MPGIKIDITLFHLFSCIVTVESQEIKISKYLVLFLQLALEAGVFYDKVSNVTIWGNHSTTQVIEQIPLNYLELLARLCS